MTIPMIAEPPEPDKAVLHAVPRKVVQHPAARFIPLRDSLRLHAAAEGLMATMDEQYGVDCDLRLTDRPVSEQQMFRGAVEQVLRDMERPIVRDYVWPTEGLIDAACLERAKAVIHEAQRRPELSEHDLTVFLAAMIRVTADERLRAQVSMRG